MQHVYNLDETRNLLASLRSLSPGRRLGFLELIRIAELQASRLLELTAVETGPVPIEIVSQQPRIRVEWRELPTSGMSYWDGRDWVIYLNRSEPATRQRFTLFHEYKHIVDHSRVASLYGPASDERVARRAEQVADYFAGCVLMPKRLLKRAWGQQVQRAGDLARMFDVSTRAIDVRLAQVGLGEPTVRCLPIGAPGRRPARGDYYRQRAHVSMPLTRPKSTVVAAHA